MTVLPVLAVLASLQPPLSPAAAEVAPLRSSPLAALLQDAAAPAAEEPPPHWEGSVNIGVTITDGNTEQRTINTAADAKLRREHDRTTVGLFWNYADKKDPLTGGNELTERNAGGNVKYDYFVSEKMYYLAEASAETDELADVDLRWTAGLGAGYQFKEEEDLKLSGEGGLSWVDEDFEVGMDDGYLALRLSYDVDWAFKEGWKFLQTSEFYPSLEDSDDVYAKVDTRVQASLTEAMFAQLQWVMDYDNTPSPGLERVDNRYILTLGWSF